MVREIGRSRASSTNVFGSLRRFNAVFAETYGRPLSDIRKRR